VIKICKTFSIYFLNWFNVCNFSDSAK
jgi:hypothetical protein